MLEWLVVRVCRGAGAEARVAGAQHVLCAQWVCGSIDGWGGGGHHSGGGLLWGSGPPCPSPHP